MEGDRFANAYSLLNRTEIAAVDSTTNQISIDFQAERPVYVGFRPNLEWSPMGLTNSLSVLSSLANGSTNAAKLHAGRTKAIAATARLRFGPQLVVHIEPF